MKTYVAKSVVYFNAKRYPVGSQLPLSDVDALPLLAKGHIAVLAPTSVTVVEVPVALGSSTLSKMTVAELTDYAVKSGIAVEKDASKDAIIAALTPAAKADAQAQA